MKQKILLFQYHNISICNACQGNAQNEALDFLFLAAYCMRALRRVLSMTGTR